MMMSQQQTQQSYRMITMNMVLCAVVVASTVASTASAFVTTSSSAMTRHIDSRGQYSVSLSSTAAVDNEGLIKTITKQGTGKVANLGDIATIKYSCYLPDDEKAIPFSRSDKQKMVRFVKQTVRRH